MTAFSDFFLPLSAHLLIVPIVLPIAAAALMLLLGERRRRAKALLGMLACTANLAVALALLGRLDAGAGGSGALEIYLPGNWPVPFGIVLVADRLSAALLLLTAVIALASVLFAVARWDRAGVHFHALLQIQLLGLNGAFLTADLFNLFVFFEVLLAASYGLVLHGSGRARVAAGLHYVAINLCASFLFLLAVAILYRVTGTLGMADIAQKIAQTQAADDPLLHAGAALLAVAFLTKAAIWPLNFWLVPAYSAASAPVAGLFVVLSKVGVYSVLRLWTLWFPGADGSAPFGSAVLVWAGLATLVFGIVGTLASQAVTRLAGFSLIVSSGTLIAAIGFAHNALTAGALFYLFVSTLATSALFLLSELIDRSRVTASADAFDDAGRAPVPRAAFELPPVAPIDPLAFDPGVPPGHAFARDELPEPVGQPIRAAMAFLGFTFIACALLIAGLPPLAGFLSKFLLISAALGMTDARGVAQIGAMGWAFVALVAASGIAALIALSRVGIRVFWAPQPRQSAHLRLTEAAPVAALLLVALAIGIWPAAALRYLNAAAAMLLQPAQYVSAVANARPIPAPPQRKP